MSFRLAHKIVTYLFAGLGLSALTLGSALSKVQLIVIGVCFALSWFAEEPLLSKRGYSRFWTVAAVVVLTVQVVRVFMGAPVLGVGVEYAAFLQLSKLAHRKNSTDHQQIAILGFLHLISGTVLSSTMEYGFIFLGFVVVMPWMLALTHIRRELELQHKGDERVLGGELEKSGLATPAFFAGTTLLALPLFAVTATFFFMFPRVGFGYFSSFGARTERIAGFGDDIELGGFGTIRDDPTVVMRIKPHQLPEPPPPSISIRLRGTSFDHYEGGRWTRSRTYSVEVPRSGDEYAIFRTRKAGDWQYTIILDPIDEPVLFLPEGTVALKVPPRVQSGREQHRPIFYSPGLDFRYRHQVQGQLTYQAFIDPALDRYPERFTASAIERYLKIPGDYQRVSTLAQEVAGGETDPAKIARRIEIYLGSNEEFRYTLEQPDTKGDDPLHVFLFDTKAGHCEYFSSAMAVMLRSLKIPARNVTGFVGADFNPYGGYYAVRNGNAHSWVEAFIDGQWVVFDPTPSQAVAAPSGVMLKLRQVMDALRIRWAEYVVEYNVRDQARALSRIADWYHRLRLNSGMPLESTQKDKPDSTPSVLKNFDMRKLFVLLFPLGLLVGIAIWFSRRRRPRGAAKRTLSPEQERALRLYLLLDERLRSQGYPRAPDVTPRQHLEQLRLVGFASAEDVEEITQAYLLARFGSRPMGAAEYQRLRGKTRTVRAD